MLMPPETSTENKTTQTNARIQGNLLRDYEQRSAALNSAFNAGLAKTVENGQFFMTLDDEELDRLKRIMSRVHFASK